MYGFSYTHSSLYTISPHDPCIRMHVCTHVRTHLYTYTCDAAGVHLHTCPSPLLSFRFCHARCLCFVPRFTRFACTAKAPLPTTVCTRWLRFCWHTDGPLRVLPQPFRPNEKESRSFVPQKETRPHANSSPCRKSTWNSVYVAELPRPQTSSTERTDSAPYGRGKEKCVGPHRNACIEGSGSIPIPLDASVHSCTPCVPSCCPTYVHTHAHAITHVHHCIGALRPVARYVRTQDI